MSKKQTFDHVLVFLEPKFSRDKGIIRLCRNDPNQRFKVKTIKSIREYINTEQYQYQINKIQKMNFNKMYYGIMPIMYLSEWKTSTAQYKKWFLYSICRGFPRLQIISHKGNIANLLNKYYSSNINTKQDLLNNNLFYPRTWVIPNDSNIFNIENPQFCNTCNYNNNDIKFIVKPQGASKGNGISLITKKSDINFNQNIIIQKYINNPLLINQRKIDLRLYVFIASINPLQVYIYDKGLVRFASGNYSKLVNNDNDNNDIDVLCSHLTNYTLNKRHPSYLNKDCEIKWSLNQFWEYLAKKDEEEKNDKDSKEYVLNQIYNIIRNVFNIGYNKLNEGFLFNFSSSSKNNGRCFDILGMDVLIDNNYKCWLMEFNRYPSLKCEHDIDKKIKYLLCDDIFKMLKPRLICNNIDNVMYNHKIPVILNPNNTGFKRIL